MVTGIQVVWWVTVGLVAVVDQSFYVVGEEHVFAFEGTTWGWTHILLDVVLVAAAVGLCGGAMWARFGHGSVMPPCG
jgi:hypothetical protein